MKQAYSIVGIILLVAALIGVNRYFLGDSDSSDKDSPAAQKAAAPPTAPAYAMPEIVVNDATKAAHVITIGWNYDEQTEEDSKSLGQILVEAEQAAQDSGGKIALKAVDVDLPDSERSPATRGMNTVGVTIDGVPAGNPGNPGEGPLAVLKVKAALVRLQ